MHSHLVITSLYDTLVDLDLLRRLSLLVDDVRILGSKVYKLIRGKHFHTSVLIFSTEFFIKVVNVSGVSVDEHKTIVVIHHVNLTTVATDILKAFIHLHLD